jgi:hypothetical protein
MCARHVLGEVIDALPAGIGLLAALRRCLAYLLDHACRANPKRDRNTGRESAGLRLVEARP